MENLYKKTEIKSTFSSREKIGDVNEFKNEKVSALKDNGIDCLESFSNKSIPEKKEILKKLGMDCFELYSNDPNNNKDLRENFEWMLTQIGIKAVDLANKDTEKNKIIEPISTHIDVLKLGELSDESMTKLKESNSPGKNLNAYQELEILKNANIKKALDFISKSMKEKIKICVDLGWMLPKYLSIENSSNKASKLLGRLTNPIDEDYVNTTFFENFEKLSQIIEWKLPPEQYLQNKEFEDCESRFEKGSWVKNVIPERMIQYNIEHEKSLNIKFKEEDIVSNKGLIGVYPSNEEIKSIEDKRLKIKVKIIAIAALHIKNDIVDAEKKVELFSKLESKDETPKTLEFIFGKEFSSYENAFKFEMGFEGLTIDYLKKELLRYLKSN